MDNIGISHRWVIVSMPDSARFPLLRQSRCWYHTYSPPDFSTDLNSGMLPAVLSWSEHARRFNHGVAFQGVTSMPNPNDQCPCGSGKLYKDCRGKGK
ncbi:MAG: SEC-C metal-binding domain-containing protein [Candidatus Binataceae bacterium]